MILHIIISLIFLTLGLIHFYWVFGGEWGLKAAIPTKENEETLIKPPLFATILVGLILVSLALFYMVQTEIFSYKTPKWTQVFLWIIPAIFLIRAIGDFKYVGFFKRIKTTYFAKWDTKLFSPLCLCISLVGFLIYFLR